MNTVRLGWAYRLTGEPGRLWTRYSLDYLAYGRMVARAGFGTRKRARR